MDDLVALRKNLSCGECNAAVSGVAHLKKKSIQNLAMSVHQRLLNMAVLQILGHIVKWAGCLPSSRAYHILIAASVILFTVDANARADGIKPLCGEYQDLSTIKASIFRAGFETFGGYGLDLDEIRLVATDSWIVCQPPIVLKRPRQMLEQIPFKLL